MKYFKEIFESKNNEGKRENLRDNTDRKCTEKLYKRNKGILKEEIDSSLSCLKTIKRRVKLLLTFNFIIYKYIV